MSKALEHVRPSPGERPGNTVPANWQSVPDFQRTIGQVQILHIELWYVDGTKGEINLTSPHYVWGEEMENQWIHMRAYLNEYCQRLGIIRYCAHRAYVKQDGTLKYSHSWYPFNCVTGQYEPL